MSNQRHRVLHALKVAGKEGVTNGQFVGMHVLRFGARLDELREAGYEIETARVSQGCYRYRLLSEPPVPSRRDVFGPLLGETTEARDGVRSASRPEGTGGTTLFEMEPDQQDGTVSAITGKRAA